MNIFKKFQIGLNKTSTIFSSSLLNVLTKNEIDQEVIDEIENILLSSDIGIEVTNHLIEKIKSSKLSGKEDSNLVLKILCDEIEQILKSKEKILVSESDNKPSALIFIGVNGSGKTTTIGKLGKILGKNNKKIVFGAADTFRAAAVNQLDVWAKKINADIVKSEEGSDPASVAYKALEHAKNNNFDYLLIDTAGRLQNKKNLMDEFKKITKVLKKIDSNAPHETFLILDATTGQSAINQVEEFKKITPVTGIIMTKLDGTAKGGILLAIGKKFKLPIIALGMGEKEDDLQTFNSEYFANALMHFYMK